MANGARGKRRKNKTESYKGWTIRYIVPPSGARNVTPYWQTDNGKEGKERERKSWASKTKAQLHIDTEVSESENFGRTFAIDSNLRIDALKAFKDLNGRISLTDLAKYWVERNPPDGKTIVVSKMVDTFLATRIDEGNRPETIRELRRKLATFTEVIGAETSLAGIGEGEVAEFIKSRPGGASSRRSWKKVLNSFFNYCQDQKAVITNPVRIKLPKSEKKTPSFWDVAEVKSALQTAMSDEPEIVAGLAVLFFAGLRPTELVGQYGLEDPAVTKAKKESMEAQADYDEEKARLGLNRGRGADTVAQKAARAVLAASEQYAKLVAAQAALRTAQKRSGGHLLPGLQWADVHMEENFIRVRAETSKVGEGRLVEITPNLTAWLAKFRKDGGAVVSNPMAFRRARERIRAAMGKDQWPADVTRHCFATYHFAAFQNREKLAAQMGHSTSSRQIELHYKGLATKQEADKYWAITPDREPNSVNVVAPQK